MLENSFLVLWTRNVTTFNSVILISHDHLQVIITVLKIGLVKISR